MSANYSATPSNESKPTLKRRLLEQGKNFFLGHSEPSDLKLLENRTAWRIRIPRTEPKADGQLILAPFAKRILPTATMRLFSVPRWEKRGLLRVQDHQPPQAPPPFFTFVRVVVWLSLILAVFAFPVLWVYLEYWGLLLLSLLSVLLAERQPIFRWVGEALNLLAIVFVTLTLSLAFYQLIVRGQPETNFTVQIGAGTIAFIVLASSVPALMYYLFERQKIDVLRDFFLREVIRLDPNVHTLDDAEFRYGPLADEVYGRKRTQDFLGGLQVSLLINLALTTMGWCLALLPNITRVPTDKLVPHEAVPLLIVPLLHPVIFGALGSYFFGLNLLFRRYLRADLGPKAYTHFAVRQLLTVVLVWVVSVPTQLWGNLGALGQGALLVFAFLVGIVPETAFALVQDYLRNLKILTERIPALREDQPLSKLEGVSLYDRARLLEEGIENIENLAHHNLIDLMLRTRIPTSRLMDMIDQAILYLHVVDPAEASATASAERSWALLRTYGIRTATDLEHAYEAAQKRSAADAQAFLSILDAPGQTPHRLRVVLDTLEDDEWMSYLREWHANKSTIEALLLEQVETLLGNPLAPVRRSKLTAQSDADDPDPQPG